MHVSGRSRLGVLVILATMELASPRAGAQFNPGLLANDSYWSDGKAEFDIYEAQIMRGGQSRKCELFTIFNREKVDPKTFSPLDDSKKEETVPVIRMSAIWTLPLGLFVEQEAQAMQWRPDGSLLRLLQVGTDSLQTGFLQVLRSDSGLSFVSDSTDTGGGPKLTPPANSFFYEELPLRVRTIDWQKPPAEFEIQLAAPLASTKEISWKPAEVSWRPAEKRIEVVVKHEGGSDHFSLDQQFPFLLREWQMANGSRWKLKRDLKADYWNYGKNGDRERALNNPMLQHPD